MPEPIRVEQIIASPIPPERLWLAVANTDAVNRTIGLPAVRYSFSPKAGGGAQMSGAMRLFGIPLEWQEMPYEWIRPNWFSVERIFSAGLVERYRFGAELQPDGAGAKVRVWGEFYPRYGIVRPIVKLIAGDQVRKYAGAVAKVVERTGQAAPVILPASVAVDTGLLRASARRAAEALRPDQRPILERLVSDIERLPDADVVRVRPFEWADARGFARFATMEAFLHATVAGLLEMEWALLCPHCRGRADAVTKLADVPETGECPSCAKKFDVEFDRAIEARFTVARGIRTVSTGTFCRGNPMATPFIAAQLRVPAGGGREVAGLPVGAFRAKSGDRETALFVRAGQPAAVLDGGDGLPLAGDVPVVESGSGLKLRHTADHELLCTVEPAAWESQAATAAFVAPLLGKFRLFASDLLRADQKIVVRRIVFMFSDLTGSTEMYQKLGDARAFSIVRDHFEIINMILAERGGTMVKTIGDAVMAVFPRAEDAVRAARAIHAKVTNPVVLRIGIHAGPALAVQLDGRNDFFGTTVNEASRLEHLAKPGEILLSDAIADEMGHSGARETVRLRGIDRELAVVRETAANPNLKQG